MCLLANVRKFVHSQIKSIHTELVTKLFEAVTVMQSSNYGLLFFSQLFLQCLTQYICI